MSYLAYGILQLGFCLLSLSLKKHYRTVFQKPSTPQRLNFYKAIGFALVAISGIIYWDQYGTSLGLVWWFTMMCPAIFIPAMFFATRQAAAAKPS